MAAEIDIEIELMFIGSGIKERQDAEEMDRSSTMPWTHCLCILLIELKWLLPDI